MRRGMVLAAALVLATTGCGGGGGAAGAAPSSTSTVAATPAATTTAPPSTTTTTATTSSAAQATPHVTTTVTSLTDFASPSGNIGCYVDSGTARCDIDERSWTPPAPPASCDVDYGQGVGLDGPATLVCAGDTALGSTRPLAYGDAIRSGGVLCTSLTSGMECRDQRTGHGFRLSKAAYELY